jgi:hypothetical protein
VVVGDLDGLGTGIGPDETGSVLVVDADRVLSGSIAGELLEAVARRNSKAVQFGCRVDQAELLLRGPLQVRPEGANRLTVPDLLGAAVPEGPDHSETLSYHNTIA